MQERLNILTIIMLGIIIFSFPIHIFLENNIHESQIEIDKSLIEYHNLQNEFNKIISEFNEEKIRFDMRQNENMISMAVKISELEEKIKKKSEV